MKRFEILNKIKKDLNAIGFDKVFVNDDYAVGQNLLGCYVYIYTTSEDIQKLTNCNNQHTLNLEMSLTNTQKINQVNWEERENESEKLERYIFNNINQLNKSKFTTDCDNITFSIDNTSGTTSTSVMAYNLNIKYTKNYSSE